MLFRAAALVLLIGCRAPRAARGAAPPADSRPADGAPADTGGDAVDGTPMRRACTSTFGTALSPVYGRMDGYLVAIVPPAPSTAPCNADLGHLHLQVLINGAVYDVAVNVGTNDATNDV